MGIITSPMVKPAAAVAAAAVVTIKAAHPAIQVPYAILQPIITAGNVNPAAV